VISLDHLENAVQDGFQPRGQVFDLRALASGGFDGAAGDIGQLLAGFFDDPEAGEPQPGVDAKNA
jgi:hypothetical protein